MNYYVREIRNRQHETVHSNNARDNRKSRRLPVQIEVELEGGIDVQSGQTADIGRGGLFVASRRPLQVGERVRARLTLPGLGLHVEPWCEVRWIRDAESARRQQQPMGMGLEFVKVSPLIREAINAFINRQEEMSSPFFE
jgi:uncharacterized protein (TIGR02266 family)